MIYKNYLFESSINHALSLLLDWMFQFTDFNGLEMFAKGISHVIIRPSTPPIRTTKEFNNDSTLDGINLRSTKSLSNTQYRHPNKLGTHTTSCRHCVT